MSSFPLPSPFLGVLNPGISPSCYFPLRCFPWVSPPPSLWHSTQLIRCILDVEYGSGFLLPLPVIDQHPVIDSSILALKFQHRLWCLGFQNKMIVTVRAVLVTFFKFCGIFSEGLLALFADEGLAGCVRLRVDAGWDVGDLTMSIFCSNSWSSDSWWHSAQSNHFRPVE